MGLTIAIAVIAATAIWVFADATSLGVRKGALPRSMLDAGPLGWFLAVVVIWIVAFPMYLAARPRYVEAKRQRDSHDGVEEANRVSG